MSSPKNDVIAAANAFSVRLYQAVQRSTPEKDNLMISPLSASVLLALTRQGAGGETKLQLDSALNLSGLDPESTAAGYKQLLEELNQVDDVLLSANWLFSQQGLKLKEDFRRVASNSYFAGEKEVQFENDITRIDINTWVEQNTQRKIKNLLSEGTISAQTKLLLVNATHFKGDWLTPFDANETTTQTFYSTPSSQFEVPTMNGVFQLNWGEMPELDARAVRMPYYGTGDPEIHMTILLPNTKFGLKKLEDNLNQLDVNNITPNSGSIHLSLPKVNDFESTFHLKEQLETLGITQLFYEGAELNGITEESLYVDGVVHKTYIKVDELGSNMAGGTGQSFNGSTPTPRSSISFRADHPFLIIVSKGNIILFIGRVSQPICL